MPVISIFIIACVISYLLGAVPFGYIVGRLNGIDIRRVGSCNIGAANVFRSVGKGWGILTFAGDALKGFTPVYFLTWLARSFFGYTGSYLLPLLCACFAIIGHIWPVYLGFKGGKGIATSAGAMLGIVPRAVGLGLLAWLIVFIISRYVSLASIIAALIVAVAAWLLYAQEGYLLPSILTILGLLTIWRHRENIKRLMRGTENRMQFGKKLE